MADFLNVQEKVKSGVYSCKGVRIAAFLLHFPIFHFRSKAKDTSALPS